MKNVEKRIDQSVQLSTEAANMKSLNEPNTAVRAEELKSVLVQRLSAEYAGVEWRRVNQAVNEADALASLTPVPFLVLPVLAEEKVQQAAAWSAHQCSVLANSVALAA
jgi:hypothetical protein